MKQIFNKFISENEIQTSLNEEIEKVPPYIKLLFQWRFWVAIYLVAIIIDIIFIFIGTDYKNSDFQIIESIFTNIAFIVLFLIILLIVYRFYLQFLALRKNLVEKYNPSYKFELLTVKIFKWWKILCFILASLVLTGIAVGKIFIWSFPSYRPMNIYGYIIEGYYFFVDFLFGLLIFIALIGIIDISRFIIRFSKEVDSNSDFVIKPTQKDKSGGFLSLSVYLFKINLTVSFISALYILYIYFNGAIRNELGIYYILFDLILLSILPLVTFAISFLVPQISYMRVLRKYKKEKLLILYKKKHAITEKIFQSSSIADCDKDPKKMKEYNESLLFYNNLIAEIEQITDWPIQRRFFIILLTTSIFPIILFVVEQLITKYVFDLW